MPFESDKQRRAMYAAAEGESNIGIPKSVGEKFIEHDAIEYPTEIELAKAIRDGSLESPQRYENVWLFNVRITGTGTSYRPAHDEFVYRPPEDFLTDDFLERCNGLPLIFEHPDSPMLNTDEYRERSIGVVILPYLKDDEVWGIAKVFDDDAAELMKTSHISTSPAVVFRNAGSTETVDIDGDTVLIEGKPSYVDHLAICEHGVWDKGGEPLGVTHSNEEKTMADEEKVPAWAAKLVESTEKLTARMDSMEEKFRLDEEAPEEPVEEVVVKDEEESEEPEEKVVVEKDEDEEVVVEDESDEEEAREAMEEAAAAGEAEKEAEEKALEYADSVKKHNELQKKIDAMQNRLDSFNRQLSSEERDALAQAQSRADGLAQMFGEQISGPLHGETPIQYRKRLADKFKKHSSDLKNIRMDSLDDVTFGVMEERIYQDASRVARSPSVQTPGRLIPMVRRDSAGREITTYSGDIDAWMNNFKGVGQTVNIDRHAGKGAK